LNSQAMCESELDLELADALPHRDTLTLSPITIVVTPTITVANQIGVANAITVLSKGTTTIASAINILHL
jgi:hypothetical protein